MATTGPDGVATLGDPAAPPVLLLHSWWGLNEGMRWWADQLVAAGRRVLLPDLFDGAVPTTEAEAEELADMALGGTEAYELVERCADDLSVTARAWCAIGFSMGAFLACHLAGRGESDPQRIVCFYSGRPPKTADVRTAALDLHVVPDDKWFEEHELSATDEGFRACGTKVTVHRYAAEHWFAEPGSPAYDAEAASLALGRVTTVLSLPPRPTDAPVLPDGS